MYISYMNAVVEEFSLCEDDSVRIGVVGGGSMSSVMTGVDSTMAIVACSGNYRTDIVASTLEL